MTTPIGIPSPGGLVRALGDSRRALNASFERLATGSRLNRASDDPAGSIAAARIDAGVARLDAEIRGLERSNMVLAVRDEARSEMASLLRERDAIAVRAANTGAMSDAEREALAVASAGIERGLERAAQAEFNGERVFADGEVEPDAEDAAGANARAAAEDGIAARENEAVMRQKAREMEALAGAGSRLRDTDYARETSELVRAQIMQRAGIAVLGAHRHSAQTVLDLLA